MHALRVLKRNLRKFYTLLSLIFIIPGLFYISGNSDQNEINLTYAVNRLSTAAVNFINSFEKDRRESLVFNFDNEERFNWDYVPAGREGIPLKELDKNQKNLLRQMLEFSLSSSGIKKTEGVIILEKVLHELSGRGSYRDPGKYYITVFGDPGNGSPWGWRYEGHHLSLNFTVIEDSVMISTPMFFGANPAEVKAGEHKGLRVLKEEEDFARILVNSLNEDQLRQAVIEEDAPGEIITGNDERVDPLIPKGIPASKLSQDQQKILIDLVKVYINNSHFEFGERRHTDPDKINFNELFFGWAGEREKGKPHYYRIQSSKFLIEYDNTQNNANHIHSVWRDFNNDFGEDMLRKHYREHHN